MPARGRLRSRKRPPSTGLQRRPLSDQDGSMPPAFQHDGDKEMIKKLMLAVAALAASMSCAFAQVDVNKADASALDGVKGVGPATSKLIIDARTKGGDFKDWADFEKRVKGMGEKRAAKLSKAGLQVNGKPLDGAPMEASAAGQSATGAKADKAADKAAKPAKGAKAAAAPAGAKAAS
jgi:competence protein ComEA